MASWTVWPSGRANLAPSLTARGSGYTSWDWLTYGASFTSIQILHLLLTLPGYLCPIRLFHGVTISPPIHTGLGYRASGAN